MYTHGYILQYHVKKWQMTFPSSPHCTPVKGKASHPPAHVTLTVRVLQAAYPLAVAPAAGCAAAELLPRSLFRAYVHRGGWVQNESPTAAHVACHQERIVCDPGEAFF